MSFDLTIFAYYEFSFLHFFTALWLILPYSFLSLCLTQKSHDFVPDFWTSTIQVFLSLLSVYLLIDQWFNSSSSVLALSISTAFHILLNQFDILQLAKSILKLWYLFSLFRKSKHFDPFHIFLEDQLSILITFQEKSSFSQFKPDCTLIERFALGIAPLFL